MHVLEAKSSEEMRSLLKGLRRRLDPACARLGDHERLGTRRGRVVSQEELAEAVGISRGWYASLERGTIRPSLALLKRLVAAVDATPDERIMLVQLAIPELRGLLRRI
jgi:DNA-binding XRE family transcriptional regulator